MIYPPRLVVCWQTTKRWYGLVGIRFDRVTRLTPKVTLAWFCCVWLFWWACPTSSADTTVPVACHADEDHKVRQNRVLHFNTAITNYYRSRDRGTVACQSQEGSPTRSHNGRFPWPFNGNLNRYSARVE